MSRGFMRAGLASTIAALLARSPCVGIARRLDLDAGGRHVGRQRALGLQRLERRRNASFDLCEHVHGSVPEGWKLQEKLRPG